MGWWLAERAERGRGGVEACFKVRRGVVVPGTGAGGAAPIADIRDSADLHSVHLDVAVVRGNENQRGRAARRELAARAKLPCARVVDV